MCGRTNSLSSPALTIYRSYWQIPTSKYLSSPALTIYRSYWQIPTSKYLSKVSTFTIDNPFISIFTEGMNRQPSDQSKVAATAIWVPSCSDKLLID